MPKKKKPDETKMTPQVNISTVEYHFKVKDILRMLKRGAFGSSSCSEDSFDPHAECLLPEKILADCEKARLIYEGRPWPQPSCDILVVPSESLTITLPFALSDTLLEEQEQLVEREVHDAWLR